MAILEVLKFPDPKLRLMCKAVDNVDEELKAFAADMLETMHDFNGIGLAAAQVDHARLAIIDTSNLHKCTWQPVHFHFLTAV